MPPRMQAIYHILLELEARPLQLEIMNSLLSSPLERGWSLGSGWRRVLRSPSLSRQSRRRSLLLSRRGGVGMSFPNRLWTLWGCHGLGVRGRRALVVFKV